MTKHIISSDEARKNLLACAAYLAEEIQTSEAQAEAMQAVIPLYLAENNVDTAAELANSVDFAAARERLLTDVAVKCAEINDDDYALQLIEAIEDPIVKISAVESIVYQIAARGDIDKAFEINNLLADKSLVNSYTAFRLDEKGEESEALQLIEAITDPMTKAECLQHIALEKFKKGDGEKAARLLEESNLAVRQLDYPPEKINALHTVSYRFGQIGRGDRSIEVLAEIQRIIENLPPVENDDAQEIEAYQLSNIRAGNIDILDNVFNPNDRERLMSEVSLAYFEAGSEDLADRALDKITDQTKIASVLLGFAREYKKRGENSAALETLDEAYQIIKSQHDRNTIDSAARFKVFKNVTLEYAEFDRPETAIEAAVSIPFDAERFDTLIKIAQIRAVQNDDQSVRKTISEIDDEASKAFAGIAAAAVKIEQEKSSEAVEYLNQAANSAENILQPVLRLNVYLGLAKNYAAAGVVDKTRNAARQALQTAAQIKNEAARAVVVANLAQIYKKAGMELDGNEKTLLETILNQAQ